MPCWPTMQIPLLCHIGLFTIHYDCLVISISLGKETIVSQCYLQVSVSFCSTILIHSISFHLLFLEGTKQCRWYSNCYIKEQERCSNTREYHFISYLLCPSIQLSLGVSVIASLIYGYPVMGMLNYTFCLQERHWRPIINYINQSGCLPDGRIERYTILYYLAIALIQAMIPYANC